MVQQLKHMGTQVLLLSGDTQPAVDGIAQQAGIADGSAWGGMRPEQKAAFVRQLREQGKVRAGGCAAISECMLWLHGAAEQPQRSCMCQTKPPVVSAAPTLHCLWVVLGFQCKHARVALGWNALLTLPMVRHAAQ